MGGGGTYVRLFGVRYACTNNYAVRTCILTYILGSESRVHFFLFSVVRYICRGTYVRTYVNCTLGRENPVGGGGRYVRMHSQRLKPLHIGSLVQILHADLRWLVGLKAGFST